MQGPSHERKSIATAKLMDQHKLLALLRNIQNGDENSLVGLYDIYSGVVYSVAYQVLENQQDAEEVTQDIFLRIWHKSSLFDPAKGQFLAWLLTMTRRLAIDHLRKTRRVSQVNNATSLDEHAHLLEDKLIYDDVTDLHRTLVSALQELPMEYRQAIQLSYFKGMTHAEVAQHLSKPLGTIKSHIRQGMEQLRSIWIATESRKESP